MHVHDVEVAVAQPAPHPGRGDQAELHPGDRAVVRDAHPGLTGQHDVGRQPGGVVLAGRQHRHVVAQLDELLGEIAHVRLDAAGDVPGVGADDADAHARRPSPAAVRSGRRARAAAACASPPGAARWPRRTRRRGPGSPPRTCARSRPSMIGMAGSIVSPQPFAVEVRVGRAAGRRRCAPRAAPGPDGIRVCSPKNVDLDAGAGQVAVGEQADHAVAAQPLGQHRRRRLLAAGQRDDLHPDALAVGDEAVEHRRRSQPLRDGGERAVRVHQPDARGVPVPRVVQREDHARCRAPARRRRARRR